MGPVRRLGAGPRPCARSWCPALGWGHGNRVDPGSGFRPRAARPFGVGHRSAICSSNGRGAAPRGWTRWRIPTTVRWARAPSASLGQGLARREERGFPARTSQRTGPNGPRVGWAGAAQTPPESSDSGGGAASSAEAGAQPASAVGGFASPGSRGSRPRIWRAAHQGSLASCCGHTLQRRPRVRGRAGGGGHSARRSGRKASWPRREHRCPRRRRGSA